ncbi:MAG: hypothetical protein ACD_21C00331G0001 [uncultured bacterium]|nr:MAG: hypothetical protein ACD_21C00331G0001 [uncultured bacterium]
MSYHKKTDSLVKTIRDHSLASLSAAALEVLKNAPLFDIEAAAYYYPS